MASPLAASSIVLGSPAWSGAVLVIGSLFLSLLLYSTWKSSVSPVWKWTFFSLKATAVALLVACLLDPLITRHHATPGENIVALLADQSASMGLQQANASGTRGDSVRQLLDPEQEWFTQLAQNFEIRKFAFGSVVNRVEGFDDLSFSSDASFLGAALKSLKSRFTHQPLAAILLFSDGNSTDQLPADLKGYGVPVFPVVPDREEMLQDMSIQGVSVSQTYYEDAPVTIQARVQFNGKRPQTVRATLELIGTSSEVFPQVQKLPVDEKRDLSIRMQVRPPRPGLQFYRLVVRDEQEADAAESSTSTQEATLLNNQQLIAVNRDSRASRILYVGGRPNWEYKFLNRSLADDPQLKLTGLLRIAAKEARFDFRGRAGESTNPLFRGFKANEDAETEDYSQPVLIRLNLSNPQELSDGFPKDKKPLYEFDAIILDDIEAAFFTHDQQVLLDRFVSERGGGLLMLGGLNSFRNGKWERTPVADALPVYLNRSVEGPSGDLTWQLSREGLLEPWLRLRETEEMERSRLRETPRLSVLSTVPQLKPGARLLAEVVDAQGKAFPAVVSQQYGQGRVAALLPGDFWKGFMHAEDDAQLEDAARSWRQIARWLSGDGLKRLNVTLAQGADESPNISRIQVRVRDREFQPDDRQRVTVQVETPGGAKIPLDAQPSLEESGLFEAPFVAREPGPYVARVTVPGDGDDPTRTAEIGWTSDRARDEFSQIQLNRALLTQLAAETGGAVTPYSQLEQLMKTLPLRDVPVMQVETIPLWHTPWLLMSVMILLATEWGLRRWKGLA